MALSEENYCASCFHYLKLCRHLFLIFLLVADCTRSDTMLEKLAQGTSLVIDRYAYSGVAYTSAKVLSLLIHRHFEHNTTRTVPFFLFFCF